jgi:membrane associated rhomboid family serine protease
LWIFGDNVEDYLGHFQYLLFYLICGVAAAVTHILLNAGSNLPTVGASGAISGVMGAYLLLYPRAKVQTWVVFIFFWWLPAWLFLVYWFALQLLSGAQTVGQTGQETGGVAVWAHVGGFVAGLILIKIFPPRERGRRYASW